MHDVSMILQGLLLGIGAAAPIGPVNVEIARRTLQSGFRAGFALGCGAVTVDVAYAIMVSLSIRPISTLPWLAPVIGVFGAILLLILGISSVRHAGKITTEEAQIPMRGSARNYATGLALTSLNPMTLAFWFVAVPATVTRLTRDSPHDLPLVCLGVFTAALGWVCLFTGAMNLAGKRSKVRWMKTADLAGGILLLAFAGISIWRVARVFLSYDPLSLGIKK